MNKIVALLFVITFVLAGCTVGPNYKTPDINTPAQFTEADPNVVKSPSQDINDPNMARWWDQLGDPQLSSLIEDALTCNLDLRIAAARIAQARAIRGITVADEFPNINATGSYSRSRRSFNSTPGFNFGPREQDNFDLGFDAAWELDVFGRTRRAVEAATAEIQASQEFSREVRISVAAEVARSYISLRDFQQRLIIAQNNVKSQQNTLLIVESRFKAGLTNELDLAQARAQLESTRSQIPTFQIGTRQSLHRLAVLLALEPSALEKELATAKIVPATKPLVPLGLPSQLLLRRPDIRQAERTLAAETARIGAATADLFPRFSLTGSIGQSSANTDNLFNSSSRFWSIGPDFSWPVFDAGRIRNNIRLENARQEEAMANYIQTILTSLSEVEDALVAYGREQQRLGSLEKAVAANQRSVDLSNELYSKGLVDFLNVLDNQRRLYLSQDQLEQSQRDVATDLVALYKALGGGWDQPAASCTK